MKRVALIHRQLAEAASRTPEAPAVIGSDRSLDYAELERASNRLAHRLGRLGVGPGDRIGLYLDKSPQAVVGIYAILKSGAAYVPMDPRAPVARVRHIVENCGLGVIVTGSDRSKQWPELCGGASPVEHLVVVDAPTPAVVGDPPAGVAVSAADSILVMPDEPPQASVGEDDLAYILYTSGSTGTPKGVMLSHANCLAFVHWAAGEYRLTPSDRLASVAPFHFDLSTFDLFGASAAGAAVALMPAFASVFPREIIGFIEARSITVWYSVPSILSMLTEHGGLATGDLPSLRLVLFAGEVFPTKYLARLMKLLPHAEFANLYGPTETNVCTHYRVAAPPREGDGDIPIGGALPCVRPLVVTEEGRRAAAGEVGELLVGGDTVTRGYWGDPEKTAERLVSDPTGGDPHSVYYRTGDLVEELPGKVFRFLGRRDDQVKSRGNRIELGEIETALYEHPRITECAVVAVPDEMVSNRLVAFIVSDEPIEKPELVRFCGARLPRYMIPEAFHSRDGLPKTSTGKIDRRRLAAEAG